METVRRPAVAGAEGREGWIGGVQRIGGSETTLCDIIMMNTCYYTFVQTQE